MASNTGTNGLQLNLADIVQPTLRDILAARERIAGVVRRTPIELSLFLSEKTGYEVYLKLECWQRTRSFKLRGAYNAVAALSPEQRARGLVTASAGNHGQAVALAARETGARSTIFLPDNAAETKKARIRAFGATLQQGTTSYDDAEVAARAFADTTGAVFVHAFSDASVVAGQGTVGLEVLEDVPHVKQVVVPVGGGGLIGGVGIAIKSSKNDITITGIQSSATRSMYDAFAAGQLTDTILEPTLADGLAGCVDEFSFGRARHVVDHMLLVDEAALPAAIRSLYHHDGLIAEGASATAVAAVMEGVISVTGPTVLVITGGNIDARRFAHILSSR